MTTLVLATRNAGKVRELRRMLEGSSWEVADLAAFPAVGEIEETGETFAENAILKARTVAEITGHLSLADDSGIEIDALDGRPGVRSARYAGEDATDDDNNAKLVRELTPVEPSSRTARYRCVVALAEPDGVVDLAEGTVEGRIVLEPQGEGGFGYDPYFFVDRFDRTMAELSEEEKDRISHRGEAFRAIAKVLEAKAAEHDQVGPA